MNRVRVLLFVAGAHSEVEQAYHRISEALAGTEGLLGNELLAGIGPSTGGFVVMSEWSDAEAFRLWERGSAHRHTTAPLRPYQDGSGGRVFGVYEVSASYP
jgi:heme oxygenase (mycobilin-producing)